MEFEKPKICCHSGSENISRLDVKAHVRGNIHNSPFTTRESPVWSKQEYVSINQINDASQKEIFCDCLNRMLDVTWQ